MSRRLSALTVIVLTVVAAACESPTDSDPQANGPALGKTTSPYACLFTGNPSLSSSANSYFTNSGERRDAADIIAEMQTFYETPNLPAARAKGYELLTMVGTVARGDHPGSRSVGGTLIKQAFNCMYATNGADAAGFEGWPDDAHYDFAGALDVDNGGAFYVRGGETPATTPVVANLDALNSALQPAGGNVSALAPPVGETNDTWAEVLGRQVLFFGNTVTNGYDWKVLPRNALFTPYARVALCQGVNGGGEEYEAADMIHQFGVGSLGFVDGSALCGTVPPLASLYGGGAFGAFARLTHAAAGFFSPEPLHAATLVATSTSGRVGSAKGDEFTFLNLPTVNLAVSLGDLGAKNTVKVNSGRFSVTVNVTTPAGEPAGGIGVSLSGTNNNGTGTGIYEITPAGLQANYQGCDPLQTNFVAPAREVTLGTVSSNGTALATKAVWTRNLCVTKTGGLAVVATSQADGNTAAGNGVKVADKKISVIP